MTVRVPLGHTPGANDVGESAKSGAKLHEAARWHKLVRNVSSELLGEHRTESQSLKHPHSWPPGAAVLNWTIRSENRTRRPKPWSALRHCSTKRAVQVSTTHELTPPQHTSDVGKLAWGKAHDAQSELALSRCLPKAPDPTIPARPRPNRSGQGIYELLKARPEKSHDPSTQGTTVEVG